MRHTHPIRTGLALAHLALVASIAPAANAQPSPPASAAPDEARRDEARERFQRGVALFQEEAWQAALAEFLASQSLYPTRAATKNAAVCLRTLHRFDEALETYEELLRRYSDLSPDDRSMAERAVRDLRALVGTVDVRGAEPGAVVVIDGRERATVPAREPIRVGAGTHVVRVYKEGYAPFERRVDVAGGQATVVEARIGALARAGRLRVVEAAGKTLEVFVDGIVVGKTPWEGPLAVGAHTVALRGEADLGTQPVTAPVRKDQVTPLSLVAEPLSAALRVEPTPAGASVALDGVSLGLGIWDGRLRSGAHRVEVAAEGFVTTTRNLTLERGQRDVLRVALQRDPDSPLWKAKHPPRLAFEVDGAPALAPSFGGDVAGDCSGSCTASLGLGGRAMFHGGYELGSGLGLGLSVGYLAIAQSTEGRATRVVPQGLPANPGVADDTLVLRGVAAAGNASLALGDRFPIRFRLGLGALFGAVEDRRSGSFDTVTHPGQRYATGELVESASATYFTATPEVRVGVRLGERFELSAGVAAAVLVALRQPTWADETVVYSDDGAARFGGQALTGRAFVVVSPGLSLRYDLLF